jgi:hypothetical protein
MTGKLRLGVFAMGTKAGKALSINEPIPTPKGWRTMGDLSEGDFVFDEYGKPVRITFATGFMFDHPCYEVVFSDGNTVVADAEHLWVTETHVERKNSKRCPRGDWSPKKRTTLEILDTLTVKVGGVERANHSIRNVQGPLQFPNAQLPLDPYLLGVWLGDGHSSSGCLTLNALDGSIVQRIRQAGWEMHVPPSKRIEWRVAGLTSRLRDLNLIGKKRVPEAYLTASPAQRLALLQGLMDTDGTVSDDGFIEFDSTEKNLADAVDALVVSFGIKAVRFSRIGKLNGEEKKRCYRVLFVTDLPVFSVPRKAARLRRPAAKTLQRTIVDVRPVPSVPVRCIRVDSPTHLFLAGRGCIPTHNTLAGSVRIANFSFAAPSELGALYRVIAPTYALSGLTYEYLDRNVLPERLPLQPGLSPAEQDDAEEQWSRFTPERSQAKLRMLWRHNRARIECVHGQDPERTIEGARVHGNVFDEASKMTAQVYASGLSTTANTGGWNVLYSTPRGKNYFYDLYKQCEEHMAWARKTGKPFEMYCATARTIDNPHNKAHIIEQAKRTLPDRMFRQLFLAEFLDDGSVFVGYRDLVDGDAIETDGKIQAWEHPDAKKHEVVIGIDWAKRQDYAVFVAWEIDTDEPPRCLGFRRMQGVEYKDQLRELYRFAKLFKTVRVARHDRTGIGDVLDELLEEMPFAVEPVVFTNESKAAMVDRYVLGIETASLRLPNWPQLIREHDNYDVTVTNLGKPKYGAVPGENDDVVTACFLAWSAVDEYRSRSFELRILEELTDPKKKEDEPVTVESYYNWLREDAEEDEDESSFL